MVWNFIGFKSWYIMIDFGRSFPRPNMYWIFEYVLVCNVFTLHVIQLYRVRGWITKVHELGPKFGFLLVIYRGSCGELIKLVCRMIQGFHTLFGFLNPWYSLVDSISLATFDSWSKGPWYIVIEFAFISTWY